MLDQGAPPIQNLRQDKDGTPVVRVENLRVSFQTSGGEVLGVEDVSFAINPGETVCIVGESGSGKSVSSLSLLSLIHI